MLIKCNSIDDDGEVETLAFSSEFYSALFFRVELYEDPLLPFTARAGIEQGPLKCGECVRGTACRR